MMKLKFDYTMNGDPQLYQILKELSISFEYYEHPPIPTIEKAKEHWQNIEATHCKNLFLRNHKGDRHFLVILEHSNQLNIHDLEKRLKQGKLTFASEKRMEKYLGLKPGSVSPFGLTHDQEHQVHLFIDRKLFESEKISFHPNDNTASLVLKFQDVIKFLNWTKNKFEFIDLYN